THEKKTATNHWEKPWFAQAMTSEDANYGRNLQSAVEPGRQRSHTPSPHTHETRPHPVVSR
ncbi:hypothetical protein, partial [Nocardia salmonicida]|uniref:hypothetical protein n=1 Tax=Nocardia salmonicida TaxID=53431 RepID=UPI0037A1319F